MHVKFSSIIFKKLNISNKLPDVSMLMYNVGIGEEKGGLHFTPTMYNMVHFPFLEISAY